MEVHHHSHPNSGEIHRSGKKWTHYLWEFLMLFLAVYLGFLVENLREHRIEQKRADKYIESFYQDLKSDTSKLNRVIRAETRKVKKLEIFKSCYDSFLQNQNPHSFLEIIKNSGFSNGFEPEQRTINQLSNAGGFRLLKKDDADSVTGYILSCKTAENFEKTAYQQTQDNLRNLFNQLIDFSANASLSSNVSENPGFDAATTTIPLVATGNKHMLNEYFNTLLQYIRIIVRHRNMLLRVDERAVRLIEFFKKKYGFD